MPTKWKLNIRNLLFVILVACLYSTFSFHHVPSIKCEDSSSIDLNSCTQTVLHHFPQKNTSIQTSWMDETSIEYQTTPVRIFLGISSLLNEFTERQRRHVIRNTYLDFDRLHRLGQPNRVCSLDAYLSMPFPHCQLIYTFILGPTTGTVAGFERGDELPASMFDNHETDVVYFNVDEKDHVGKRWGWLRASSKWMNTTGVSLAAYTDSHLLILPTTFWNDNPLFSSSSSHLERIYGGLPTLKKDCPSGKCVSLLRNTVMRRFVLLSYDLMQYLSSHPIPTSLTSTDAPDVAIANVLHSYAFPIRDVELHGLIAKVSTHDNVGALVFQFDRYKDSLVVYQDPQEVALVLSKHPNLEIDNDRSPRLLLGIFSMDSSIELERREMIRNTYLRTFVDTDTPHRICSLAQLKTMQQKDQCQLAYTFIVGANPTGPKEIVEENNTTGPITLTHDKIPIAIRLTDHEKGDIVYLNIQENGKEGKSQTYFKFATSVLDQHYFDYLAKTDSDTLIYPKSLLQNVIDRMPKFPQNMRTYSGDYRIKPSTQSLNLGPVYMGGKQNNKY